MEETTRRDLLEELRDDRLKTALEGETPEIRSANFKEAMDVQAKYLDVTKEWNRYDEVRAKNDFDKESLEFQKQKFETEMSIKQKDYDLEVQKLELAKRNSEIEDRRITNDRMKAEAELKSKRKDRIVNIVVPVIGGLFTLGGIIVNRVFQRSNMKLNIEMEESGHWDTTSAEREATKEACSFK